MKHTLNTLSVEVESLKAERGFLKEEMHEMQRQMDIMKESMEQFLLTTNSAYKKKKALESVDDFLGKRFGR